MNAVILSGTLARDPIIRATQKTVVAVFTVMATRQYKGNVFKDYIDCVAFGQSAQDIGNNCQAGSAIEIKGRLAKRKYQDKQGNDAWTTEVNVESVDFPGMAPQNGGNFARFQQQAPQQAPPQNGMGWGGFGQRPPQQASQQQAPQQQEPNIPF